MGMLARAVIFGMNTMSVSDQNLVGLLCERSQVKCSRMCVLLLKSRHSKERKKERKRKFLPSPFDLKWLGNIEMYFEILEDYKKAG